MESALLDTLFWCQGEGKDSKWRQKSPRHS
jgi:hypothetical protein